MGFNISPPKKKSVSFVEEGGRKGRVMFLLANALGVTLRWRPLSNGPPISGHSSAVNSNRIWAFGGLHSNGKASNTLLSFDGKAWEMFLSAPVPERRMYSSLTSLGADSLCLIGGWDPGKLGSGGTFYDDIWMYNITSDTWARAKSRLEKPISRHSSVFLSDDNLVLIHSFRNNNSVHLFDTQLDILFEQETSGPSPQGLSLQAAATVGSKVLFVGGSTKTQAMTSNTYVLDTKTWEWSCHPSEWTERASAGFAVVNGTAVVVGGGCYKNGSLVPLPETLVSDAETLSWETRGMTMEPRVASSVECLGGKIVMFGGWSPNTRETFQDVWEMTVEPSITN